MDDLGLDDMVSKVNKTKGGLSLSFPFFLPFLISSLSLVCSDVAKKDKNGQVQMMKKVC